jgi:AbiV family abortive infection protein
MTGTAASLLVLACEELAKGHHFRSMASGLTTTDVFQLGNTWVYSTKVIYEHELKHVFSAASGIIEPFMNVLNEKKAEIDAMIESVGLLEDGIDFFSDEYKERAGKIYEKFFQSDPELQRKTETLKNLMERMESIKETGFYVDIKDGKVVGPKDVPKDDYLLLRGHFDNLFFHYGSGIAGIVDSRNAALSKLVLDSLAKRQKKPSFDTYRRGSVSKRKN